MTQPDDTADQPYLTDEIKAGIGVDGPPATWPEPLERSTLRRYVNATEDHNSLYRDEAHAKASRYGGLIAPPFWLASHPLATGLRLAEVLHVDPAAGPVPGSTPGNPVPYVPIAGMTRNVNGGTEVEWFRPVYLGDTLTYKARIADITQRSGRSGPLVVRVIQTEFRNQRHELVALMTATDISMP